VDISPCVQAVEPQFFGATTATVNTYNSIIMDPPLTPPMADRAPGDEILTKHKEAMRQLYKYAKIGLQQFQGYYHLGDSIVRKILQYDVLEKVRLICTGRPKKSLNAKKIRDIIEYISIDYAIKM